jgi:CheY-like chemotaxis protein/HPt (histidine-containing phosphotransfer) domain-containing protein
MISVDNRKNVKILVAENYSVNQFVAIKHLEKAGYTVEAVDDGRQAVEKIRSKNFSLVLINVQMPVMDGYDAAQAIRTIEKEAPISAIGNRLPIIAMVDCAAQEHMSQCYAAGMDDCIAKPLRKDNLLAMVEKWIPRELFQSENNSSENSTQKSFGPRESGDSLVVDIERALTEFDGNWTFLKGIFDEFFKQVEQQVVLIGEAIEHGDAQTVRAQAHSIKGGAANLTADPLAKLALDLETRGKTGRLEGAGDVVHQMEDMIQQVKTCVDEFQIK